MGITISTHNGHAVSREHNIRNEKIVSKESHINPNGVHEIWHDEKHAEAYERIFGASVRAYNEKQQRADRKIDNYFNKIANDTKHDLACEIVIELGNMEYWDEKSLEYKYQIDSKAIFAKNFDPYHPLKQFNSLVEFEKELTRILTSSKAKGITLERVIELANEIYEKRDIND